MQRPNQSKSEFSTNTTPHVASTACLSLSDQDLTGDKSNIVIPLSYINIF